MDSPGSPTSGFTYVGRTDNFKAYFMYRPDGAGSIWVTVGVLEWNWYGSISRPTTFNSWTLETAGYTPNPVGHEASELPEWTTTIGEVF